MNTPQTGHVFVSYSRDDKVARQSVVKFLRKQEIKIWFDEEGLMPGAPTWNKEVEKAIKNAGAMVVLLSPSANVSQWVEREIGFAETHGVRILPVLIAGSERNSVPLRLTSHHRIDIRTNKESGLISLATALSFYLENPSKVGPRIEKNDRLYKPNQVIWFVGAGIVVLLAFFGVVTLFSPRPIIASISSPSPTLMSTATLTSLYQPSSTSTPRLSTSTPRSSTATPHSSPTSSSQSVYISASNVYLYQGPDLDFYTARSEPYSKGSKFTVLARSTQSNWLLCKAQDGTVGWLYKDWIDISFSISDVSVAATIPVPPPTPTRRPSAYD